ncbi:hypothetical protein ANN_24499 [Periplaneta americana]|uniref:Uncharacterized protein n=1 Tax=Periplaneta americana TaxID=6978 RepID=A0ABQ8S3J7_PERAM|nr:hypothetical protein ANN_24499 [Periplaneta americana]
MLAKVFELRDELLTFFRENNALCNFLEDEFWIMKLADIYKHFNMVNISIQGHKEDMNRCVQKRVNLHGDEVEKNGHLRRE